MRPLIRACALSTALVSGSALAAPPEPQPVVPASTDPQPQAPAPDASWVAPGREGEVGPVEVVRVAPENRRLVLAGNIVTGAGLAAFVAMTVGFLVASDARDRLGFARAKSDPDDASIDKFEGRVRTGNIVGISAAAASGALLITGLTLIGVGRSRERKRRAALEEQSVIPVFGRGVAGFSWIGRF